MFFRKQCFGVGSVPPVSHGSRRFPEGINEFGINSGSVLHVSLQGIVVSGRTETWDGRQDFAAPVA